MGLTQSAGPACTAGHQFRQLLGKGVAGTARVAAVEPPNPQFDTDPTSERRQVSWVPTVTAVHGTARVSAVRAAPARPGAVRGDMEEVRAIQRDRVNAAARHGRKLVHAVFCGNQGCNPQTSVPKRYDPRKTRENR